MNLSSYLQMPPAPLAPNAPSTAMPQGLRAGAAPANGAGSGFDFAQVMARQLERLAPPERQDLAAHLPKLAKDNPAPSSPERADDTRHAERTVRDTPRTSQDSTEADTATERDDRQDASSTRARQKNNPTARQRADIDTLLEGLMQGAPQVATPAITTEPTASATESISAALSATALPTTAAPAPDAATAVTEAQNATNLAGTAALRTVALSPHMRIITAPQAAPSPESLAEFAKSMGLDESAIQNLLAQQPSTPVTTLNPAMAASGHAMPGQTTGVQTGLSAMLQGATTPSSGATDGATALAATFVVAQAEAPVVSGAGLGAPATTLAATTLNMPGLSATDMSAIQQLQITVLPAAVMPVQVNAAAPTMPSTQDVLSLFGTGIDEHDVGALLSQFNEDTHSDTGGDPTGSHHEGDGQPMSSFAQALHGNKNSANANMANAGATTAANMGEVYDQLSDKMATELAARMHKQLSDGEWKMKFALRPSNLGGVEIQLEMKDGKLDAIFRADNPLTRDLLQNSSQRLKEALGNFGINAGQVNVGQGGGNAQQHSSGNSNKNSQVRDNSSSQVSGTGLASGAAPTRHKANASLLDLYA